MNNEVEVVEESEQNYVEQRDEASLGTQRRQRQKVIRDGWRDLIAADGLPKQNVPVAKIQTFCRAIVDEAKSTRIDEVGLRREARRLLSFDSHLIYYGSAEDGTHHFFRTAPSLGEDGTECPVGRVRLGVDGRVTNHPFESINHDEMKTLTVRPLAGNRLPAAVIYLIARQCQYLGYWPRTGHHYLWKPARGPRDEPSRELVMLRIDPQHPGVVRTLGPKQA